MNQQQRAYSLLEIKEVNEQKREISGMASTPTADRMEDIVEPLGAVFKTPMPLLHHHYHERPVGWVEFAKPTKNGIPYTARIDTPEEDDPQPLKDRINTAWKEVKRRLVRGVSIGFKPIEFAYIENGGVRFTKWEWYELSLVTIPANAEATIQTIKSMEPMRNNNGAVRLLMPAKSQPENLNGAVRLIRS
jgi:HK97 family phage prohead protease